MYKNFKLTDKEKEQILESHKSHGYKKPLNELGEKDVDLIRGIPDFQTKSGKPVGDYVSKRNASRQFQHDFGKDFADPSDEYTPHWEKDRPNPSNDSEIETDIRTNVKQADRELGNKSEKNTKFRDERIKLRRKIASLVTHKEEFGGGDELDRVIGKLRAQYREMEDNGDSLNVNEEFDGNEPKFEDGDVVHNLERAGQYPWRVVEVYKNFQEVLELNGEGEDTRKLYDSCKGDKKVLNSPFYLLKNASKHSARFAGPDFEYQSEYQMEHWDDQGNGVEID
jgi:hypothetical protein